MFTSESLYNFRKNSYKIILIITYFSESIFRKKPTYNLSSRIFTKQVISNCFERIFKLLNVKVFHDESLEIYIEKISHIIIID